MTQYIDIYKVLSLLTTVLLPKPPPLSLSRCKPATQEREMGIIFSLSRAFNVFLSHSSGTGFIGDSRVKCAEYNYILYKRRPHFTFGE